MIVHNVEKLEAVAHKINYLIQKIKNDSSGSQKLEVKLLKKYTQDLYDLLIENDFANFGMEKDSIEESSALNDQKNLIASLLQSSTAAFQIVDDLPSSKDIVENSKPLDFQIEQHNQPELHITDEANKIATTPQLNVEDDQLMDAVKLSESLTIDPIEVLTKVEPVLALGDTETNTLMETPAISEGLQEKIGEYEKIANDQINQVLNELNIESNQLPHKVEDFTEPILENPAPIEPEQLTLASDNKSVSPAEPIVEHIEIIPKEITLEIDNLELNKTELIAQDNPMKEPDSLVETQGNNIQSSIDELLNKINSAKEHDLIDEDVNKTVVLEVEHINKIQIQDDDVKPANIQDEILAKLEERKKALQALHFSLENESAAPVSEAKDIFISFEKIEDNNLPKDIEKDINKTEVINIPSLNVDTSKDESTTVDKNVLEDKKAEAPSLNDHLAQLKEAPTLGDVLSRNNEGSFDISFNQRFAYINELFGGSHQVYELTLSELAACSTVIQAFTHINLYVRNKYNWRDNDPTVKEFLSTIRKKFSPNFVG